MNGACGTHARKSRQVGKRAEPDRFLHKSDDFTPESGFYRNKALVSARTACGGGVPRQFKQVRRLG